MTTICNGCGGVGGRDCFNPQECEWISRRQEQGSYYQEGYRQGYADAEKDHLAKGAQEWQPIETAPKDGLPRLYLCNGKVIQGFVDATGSLCKQDELGWLPMRKNPTHWMPLPAAPMLSQRGECEHAWVDATNSRVSGTALCTKCGKLDSLSNHPELQP